MLKILTSGTEYMDFVHEINDDLNFSDPMLKTRERIQDLLDAPDKPARQIWGIFEGETITGLFVFLILEEESYIEMLAGLSRTKEAYEELLSFLKVNYAGYRADFVYNPNNYLLHTLLLAEGAEFDPEQQKMVLKKEISYQSSCQIELYVPAYREQYIAMHRDDGHYWTAEKVIAAPGKFRIILAINHDEVVGYIDITHSYDENEPYDVFVKEEYRQKGYGKAMLAKAIELNRPRGMMLMVDTGNTAAIALYKALGFIRSEGENSVTAHVLLGKAGSKCKE